MSDPRADVVEATARMAVLTDGRRWDELPEVFAPRVRLDHTALLGGSATEVVAVDLVRGWAGALSHLTTQHLVTNHLVHVTGDEATVTAAFQATHVADATGGRWVLGGDYRYELVRADGRWRIRGVTLTPRWETGDRAVLVRG